MASRLPHPVALRWRPFCLPLRARFEAAHGQTASREGVLVQVRDVAGTLGVGEASPYPSLGGGTVEDVLRVLARLGFAASDPAALLPGPGVEALRCAVDTALLDLGGRATGFSVADLLKQDPASSVAVNAVIGSGSPADAARYAAEAAGAGYSVLKLKVGVDPLDTDVLRVAAVRGACPEAWIRLDANGAWDEATALRAVRLLEPYGIEWIEQPCAPGDVSAAARVQAASAIQIASDESLVDPAVRQRVLEERAASVVVLKPMMLGGIRPAYDFARRAVDAGMTPVVTTTFDSSVGTAIALHLAAVLGEDAAVTEVAHGLSTGEHLAADVVARTLVPAGGRMGVPSAPGLGVEVDAAALDAVATAAWSPWVEA